VTAIRILFVGRTRFRLPLDETTRRKYAALGEVSELRVLASAADAETTGDETFHLVRPVRPRILDGLAFHLTLPLRVARELRDFRPDAVLVELAHDVGPVLFGRALARSDARVVVELHGDWRASTRLYGSRLRRVLAPFVDLLVRIGLRKSDGVRTLSPFTTELVRQEGVEPTAEFPAYVAFDAFRTRPPQRLPAKPKLLFVGVLEEYKGVDVLADAWRLAAPQVPDAELVLVGQGSKPKIVEELLVDLPRQTRWYPALPPEEVAAELDAATALVLPSRSEGLPRIVLETFCRGRAVVATPAGGIPDQIRDSVNGVIVPAEDAEALAEALVDVLVYPDWAGQLGAGAAASAEHWLATPEEFAARMKELVEAVAA
jgi:glycosyltransferase involved in cell wall biosynthesis